jgi:O-antigen/teichoic acid export membrane protein
MKQSIGLVILQITGILLSFFSVFYVAASLSPKLYAIVGVQAVIFGIISVFSNFGFETYAIRNVLHWKENGENEKIGTIVTQSIVIRTIIAFILQIPLFVYIVYISNSKFSGEYLNLFMLISVFAIPKATLDAANLILKSFNRYFVAVLSGYIVQVFGKIIALILFTIYGFKIYIITLILLPLIVLFPTLFMLKEYLNVEELFKIKEFKNNYRKSWKFALASYASYPFNYLDTLLVSIFMPSELLGSFIIGKRLFQTGKTFITNIFDPMIQKLVQYKSDVPLLNHYLQRIIKIQSLLFILGLIIFIISFLYIKDMIEFIGINEYQYLDSFFIAIIVSQIIYIAMKVKYNFIMLFYSKNYYLLVNILFSVSSVFFLFLFLQLPFKWIYYYSVMTNFIMLTFSQILYRKNQGVNYLKLKKTI